MKIGILTLPFNNNYGGLLQAYALQSLLKQRGHEVYSIKQLSNYNIKIELKNVLKKLFFKDNLNKNSNLLAFQHNYMNETSLVYKTENIKEIINKRELSHIIVGSDQVWRYNSYIPDTYKRYFLEVELGKNVKKVSFAASFGVDFWEADDEQTQMAARLIKKFEVVSVREKSGIDLCENYLGYSKAIHLLDPTFLFSADFYRHLYCGEEKKNVNKIGVYLLDSNEKKNKVVSDFERMLGKSSSIIGKYKKGRSYYYPSVQQWIKDFDTSDYIVTDSFHGMCFSMIFRKPFCVVGNVSRGLTRFTSLLDMFGLENRIISEDEIDITKKLHLLSEIDYSVFNTIIASNMLKTNEFLLSVSL